MKVIFLIERHQLQRGNLLGLIVKAVNNKLGLGESMCIYVAHVTWHLN